MAAIAAGAMTVSAQTALESPRFFSNWSMGLDGGVTTPTTNHAFFGDMRGLAGLHIQKQVTPAFAVGVEGLFGVNTSSVAGYGPHSNTVFDNSYVGAYGAVNLFNLFGGYPGHHRVFDIEAVAGAGWGHDYETEVNDYNYFATKAGLNFNFNVSKHVTISIKPSIVWDMTTRGAEQSTAAYDVNYSNFNVVAGLTYHFGQGFKTVTPYNQAEIDALNGVINDLRGTVEAQAAANAALQGVNDGLAADLAACMSRKPEVVKEVKVEVNNNLSSVRYVFFKIGSHAITADQQPNVEMIANYMKNNPKSTVVIKGYASPDGPEDVNIRLANQRAQAVKDALVKRFKIDADRITAEGEGIGNMFKEDSWNRVAICTLDETK